MIWAELASIREGHALIWKGFAYNAERVAPVWESLIRSGKGVSGATTRFLLSGNPRVNHREYRILKKNFLDTCI